jgi:glycosyltransferase involved in cell wall biosynthesis
MGKPTVATAVGEVNFAVEHEVNGLLCPEGDVKNFADSIVRLANSPKSRQEMGKAGRSKAELMLSWDANVQRILSKVRLRADELARRRG